MWRACSRVAWACARATPQRLTLCGGRHAGLRLTTQPFTTGSQQDATTQTLRRYKKVFAVSLFSGTFLLAWALRQRRARRLKDILEDFTRLPLDDSLFDANVSLYRHKGYIFPGNLVMSGVFKELPNFEFRNEDVIVASYPKTGTTWLQEIVWLLKRGGGGGGGGEVLETRFPYLEYPYPGLRTVAATPGPRLIKTHLPLSLLPPSFQSADAKLVYISRNPRDTAVSYFHFMRLLTPCSYTGTLATFFKMFLSDTVMYSPFFNHVLEYWNARVNPNILFIMYEDLHQDPVKIIKQVAKFLEVELREGEAEYIAQCTSFQAMSANPSVNYEHWKDLGFAHKDKGKFLRKGKVGDWQTHMDASDVAAFKEWEDKHLAGTDLKFKYTLQHQDVF